MTWICTIQSLTDTIWGEMDEQLTLLQHDQAKLSQLKDQARAGAEYYSEERLAKIWLDYYTRLVKD